MNAEGEIAFCVPSNACPAWAFQFSLEPDGFQSMSRRRRQPLIGRAHLWLPVEKTAAGSSVLLRWRREARSRALP